ncbi:MAG: type II toxin-antitoxin system VapC family toxin [Thermofilum sp.]|nr:type II toxin-antitoxin system VapC family toxin [Thermofilum adornatum]
MVFGEVEAYAPSLLLYEVSSVMYKALSSGVISIDDAWEILSSLKDIGIRLANFYWDELPKLLELAQQSRLTVYDSSYLLLAKKINAILVTADEDLKKERRKNRTSDTNKGYIELLIISSSANKHCIAGQSII